MAIQSTLFKIVLEIADMDRGYYAEHTLRLARHPSENNERMMVRVLAFALSAHERLEFGGGVSTTEEPALWRKSLIGEIEEWIDLGQPDPRRINRACGRAEAVVVYLYGGPKAATWWKQEGGALARHTNLKVIRVPAGQSEQLAELADRSISLQCNIHEGEVWMIRGDQTVHVTPVKLFG